MPTAEQCEGCQSGDPFPIQFTMAFQPVVDFREKSIWGYEALVRGINGEGAGTILAAVNQDNLYKFDQACRVRAIELAGKHMPANSTAKLSINFMPNAVYEPSACIRASLAAAKRSNFDPRRLMFEFTENEHIDDSSHVEGIVHSYREMGFTTALDDFGAGYAGLSLLAKFQPDLIKIDMELVRGVDASAPRKAIIKGIVEIAEALDILVLGEGVETRAEADALLDAGIALQQGYYFAKPALETFVTEDQIEVLR